MSTPTKIEVNCETGAVSEVPLTDAEIAQLEADRQAAEAAAAEAAKAAEEAAAAKAALQEKAASLGLTADEIAALSK